MNASPQTRIPASIQRIVRHQDRRLALEFFVLFSRLEYALKHSGAYLLAGEGDARPDWSLFAKEHDFAFSALDGPDVQQAVEYLTAHPPSKERRHDGSLSFRSAKVYPQSPGQRMLEFLLVQCACVARNNLFHGAKFNTAEVDASRDRELLSHCAAVLSAAINLDLRVKAAFTSGLE